MVRKTQLILPIRDSLIEMKENRSQAPSQDPLRSWFDDRLAVLHDLQHVLTGYGTDSIGENALLLFTRGQNLAGPGLRTYTTLTVLGSAWRVRRFIWDAYTWGRRVPSLVAAPYEQFPDNQLRTLQRRVKSWRSAAARRLVFTGEEPAATSDTSLLAAHDRERHDENGSVSW